MLACILEFLLKLPSPQQLGYSRDARDKRNSRADTVNRTNFRRLAEIRIVEARVLIDNRKYDGGYYLAGYAVECGLKACIAKLTKVYDFPPKSVNEYYTHDLEKLVKTAGLTIERNTDAANDPDLAAN